MQTEQGLLEDLRNKEIPMRKTILKLAWPVIAEQSLATITQIVDMMMVGRLGAASITAIGLSIQPLFLAQSLGAAISVGTTALVARYIGANKEKRAGKVLQQSILIISILSIMVLSLYYYFAEKIYIVMGAESQVIPLGTSYLRLIIPGLYFMFIGFMISAALRGAGDTKTPMKINILVNILNVIGNYILIFGHFGFPELGLNGAAVATSIARGLGGLFLLRHIFTNRSRIKVSRSNFFKIDTLFTGKILKIGLPAAMEQLVMRVAQILYVRIVAELGTVAYAAHQIAINAESISYMPGFGIAVATSTLVGQNLGAKQAEIAERSAFESWKIGALVMGFMSLVFLTIPEILIGLYSDNQEIIRLGARNLRIIAFAQIPMGTQFIFAGALRGAGDTRPVFYSTALSSWIARLGMGFVFVKIYNWGLVGAWLAMVIDWVMRGSYVFLRFKKGSWKEIKV